MFIAQIIMLVLAVALMAASAFLMPKAPKQSFATGDTPTAKAGIPVPLIVGTVLVKDPNCLGWWDNQIHSYKAKV